MCTESLTVGIVDNDPLVSQALVSMFDDQPSPLHVLWNVRNGHDALALCEYTTTQPNVVLTDLRMPGMDGKQLATHITRKYPQITVIGITAFPVENTDEELREAGIHAVLFKEAAIQDYVHTIGHATGKTSLITWQQQSLAFQRLLLTDTEISVLREYLKGRTTIAVAHTMHMSEGTVKTHMNNAYKKLGVHSRAEAIRVCVREHIV
ncbi:response regulator transcription factor [Bifidobacterium eulemuris]|uniref:DNA-binding response regulator n=1 Tax=Bifidobacterium eulemuris TaxID=1765219 RepID=A0A261G428_9BIFI|nr:response regulator transcription factor [Bifidobacterium eulemuris]OZG65943.1 DNA-binding response regulator [Bifidobacterium eulemuris]QOL32008.1 response regulator transcription factor [Bifidobacterium eulemuris]